jgi:digeranylgeranylglycerophospholipid reductase
MNIINYDVAVVGAGPAGTMTARVASEKGLDVILIEEHPEVGIPLYCAEGLSLQGIRDAGLKPEPGIVSQKITMAKVFAPKGNYVELTSDEWLGYNLNRPVFDRALADKAVEAGADLMLNTRVMGIIEKQGKIVGVKADHRGKEIKIDTEIVVGADGYASIIRRSAGLDRWFPDVVSCAQYQLTGLELEDPETNEFYLGEKSAPGGYAWVFPKSEKTANVGLGVRIKHTEPAIEYLKRFIALDNRFENASILQKGGGICPVSGILDKIVDDGLMLVGDAAGELIPMTGAGIHTAISAGRIAGEVAYESIAESDTSATNLSKYRERFESYWGKRIRDSRRAVEMLDKFSDEDLNIFAEVITSKDVLSLANGTDVPLTLARLMKRSPLKIMRLIKAYLL